MPKLITWNRDCLLQLYIFFCVFNSNMMNVSHKFCHLLRRRAAPPSVYSSKQCKIIKRVGISSVGGCKCERPFSILIRRVIKMNVKKNKETIKIYMLTPRFAIAPFIFKRAKSFPHRRRLSRRNLMWFYLFL